MELVGLLKSMYMIVPVGAGGMTSTSTLLLQHATISIGEITLFIFFITLKPFPRLNGYPDPPVKVMILPAIEPLVDDNPIFQLILKPRPLLSPI